MKQIMICPRPNGELVQWRDFHPARKCSPFPVFGLHYGSMMEQIQTGGTEQTAPDSTLQMDPDGTWQVQPGNTFEINNVQTVQEKQKMLQIRHEERRRPAFVGKLQPLKPIPLTEIAVQSNHTLMKACAMEVFSTFMLNLASKIEVIAGEARIIENQDTSGTNNRVGTNDTSGINDTSTTKDTSRIKDISNTNDASATNDTSVTDLLDTRQRYLSPTMDKLADLLATAAPALFAQQTDAHLMVIPAFVKFNLLKPLEKAPPPDESPEWTRPPFNRSKLAVALERKDVNLLLPTNARGTMFSGADPAIARATIDNENASGSTQGDH
jgi:hypothetical protein